jgi:hypothetical protein
LNADWVTPEPGEVQVVVGSLADENLKRLFFAELQNPNWLAPLTALGAFATDPDTWVDEKGLVQARPWPEGQYLLRIAATEPDAVTDLLLKHATSRNPWVHGVVLDAALAIPLAQAARLVPQIVKTLRPGQAWVDAVKVVTLAEAVAIDHPKQTSRLLTGAFKPKAGGNEVTPLGTRTRVVSSVDSYWFRELAPRIVPLLAGLGIDGLKSAVHWLMQTINIPSNGEPRSKYDNSQMWRPSIAPSSQNTVLDEMSDALVDIVLDTSIQIAQDGHLREVVDFLEARDHKLLARIAVETTAQVVAADPNLEVLAVAGSLLNKEPLLGPDSRPEYVHLALAAIPQLSAAEVAAWQQVIDAQVWQGPDDVMRRITAYGQSEPNDVGDEEVAGARRRMKYRLLLPLEEVLPAVLKTELEEMTTEFGEIEHPDFDTTPFTGWTSPRDHEALNTMSPDELRTFLSTWEPADDRHFGSGSLEGLTRELEVVAEKRPELLAALAGDLLALGRSYVRATVAGWTKALSTGYRPTDEVWQLLTTLVELPDSGEDAPANLSADDPVWGWAQRSAVDFATSYMTAHGVNLTSDDAARLWAVLFPLTRHLDPTPQDEIQFGGSNMDPLTLSLNTLRPAAIRAAIKLLRAIANYEGVGFAELRTHILEMLSHHIDAANDPSLAVAAVLGEALGHIWDIDHAWIEERSGELFAVLDPDDEVRARADVVVSVALRSYQTGRVFLELMRPVMLDMLSGAYAAFDHTDGWRGDRRPVLETAASHVVMGYVMGLIEDDDPLLIALTSPDVTPSVIGDALGTLGWSIMRGAQDTDRPAEAAPPEVLERGQRLIDGRVAEIHAGGASASELAGFYWWVRADVYPTTWWLPILQLASSDPGFNPKGMLGESLARAAEAKPALTVEVFDGLMPGDGESWTRHDLLQHAPRILTAALTSDDPVAQAKARKILDRLGRAGHMSILADVDRLTGGDGSPQAVPQPGV